MNFVTRNRKGVATDSDHIDRDFTRRLHRVSVKVNARLGCDFSHLFDRLQDSSLIVRHHDRDQLGVRAQGAANIGRIHQAASIHWQNGHFRANIFQMLTGQ